MKGGSDETKDPSDKMKEVSDETKDPSDRMKEVSDEVKDPSDKMKEVSDKTKGVFPKMKWLRKGVSDLRFAKSECHARDSRRQNTFARQCHLPVLRRPSAPQHPSPPSTSRPHPHPAKAKAVKRHPL